MRDLPASETPPRPPVSPVVMKLREAIEATRRMERVLGEELALKATDLAAMDHLSRHGSSTPTELAHRLGVTTAAATFLVDRLSNAGHVVRSPHVQDRRKTVVEPTAGSLARIGIMMGPVGAVMDEHLAGLDDHDRAVILDFLDAVVRSCDSLASG